MKPLVGLLNLLMPVIALAGSPDLDWRPEDPARWDEKHPTMTHDGQAAGENSSRWSAESLGGQLEAQKELQRSDDAWLQRQARERALHNPLCAENARNPLDAQQQMKRRGAGRSGYADVCPQPDLRFSFGDRD